MQLPHDGGHGRFSRRSFLALATLAGGTLGSRRGEAKAASGTSEILRQAADSGACGLCSLANALLRGDPDARRAFSSLPGETAPQRLDALIARYGSKPSETYGPRRARYLPDAGITSEDMPFLANDVLGAAGVPPVRGVWLDQESGEEGQRQLRRVHELFRAALASGLPPVVEVRAFAADSSASKPTWVNLYAHWLALAAVEPATLAAQASGFYCQFADSVTGQLIPAFAYAEYYRPFMATRGFALRRDGGKDWHWLTGRPYILLNLPDLPLAAQARPWHQRTLVALTFALCR